MLPVTVFSVLYAVLSPYEQVKYMFGDHFFTF